VIEARGLRPEVTVERILAWADAYHAATGRWPSDASGPVEEGSRLSWQTINRSMCKGHHDLPVGTTLARLIVEHRGPAARNQAPPLTVDQIRAWMEDHRAATGEWRKGGSGPVRSAPHRETWKAVEVALIKGGRGLPRGLTLARLRPGFVAVRPALTHARILAWADAHRAATGEWPTRRSGPVRGASREVWSTINVHLFSGGRGLPGGETLGGLLAAHRGVRNLCFLPDLTVEQILAWADASFEAHGVWPGYKSGPVEGAPGETWGNVDRTLWTGGRSLPSSPP
jgi:hypothetical protein